jgi:glycosyltransferase involved in cell wall biosynthesis
VKILHLDTGKEMRGGQRQVLLLMEALAQRGHEQALRSPLLSWPGALATFDIIHAHDARAHTEAMWRRPLVVTRRVAFPVGRGLLSRWKYRRAAHYIAVSDFVRRQLLTAGVPDGKITVIFDGVRLPDMARAAELRAAFRAERGLPADAFVAGALDARPEKPVGLFLDTAVSRGIPAIAHQAEDLSPFLFAVDCLAYLSNAEGLGSGILLAMAHGLPVLATRIGGIPEIVKDNETGLLVNNEVPEIAAALLALRDDPQRRRTMGAAARAWVAAHATDALMAERTEAVYHRLAGRPA